MKNFVVLIALFASPVFAALDPNLAGTWTTPKAVYEVDDLAGFVTIEFKPDSAIISTKCVYKDGTILTARVETKVEYTSNMIRSLESKNDEVKDANGKSCASASRPAELNYSFPAPNRMVLEYRAQGFQIDFVKL